jgi:hypothetical protein
MERDSEKTELNTEIMQFAVEHQEIPTGKAVARPD